MSEQDYFRSALASFTHDAASGGAIRHLADLGYTVDQITRQLTFPTPRERVRREVWERLLDTGVILTQEPGGQKAPGKADYVLEYDRYGRASFRKTAVQKESGKRILWRERRFEADPGDGDALALFMMRKCAENGGEGAFCSCDFGLWDREDSGGLATALRALDQRQQEDILGLPWGKRRCYHRLDQRMREIVARLYGDGRYDGVLYFLKTEEKVSVRTAVR